jgi:hypothetical protein
MLQQIYPEMSRKERKKTMQALAYRVEYETYQATLPSDELSAEQDAYSRRAIELKKAKEELAAYKKKKTAEIKAIEEEMAVQLEVINTGQREIEGNLYMFQDLQKNDMNYFDVNGMWVRSRKIRPEERQTTMAIGLSDVPVSDRERDEQETEDADAEDITAPAALGDNVDMPSEYAGMQAEVMQDAPAHTVDDAPIDGEEGTRPDDSATGEVIGGFGVTSTEVYQEEQGKQAEAEQKLAAHKANKKRLTKKEQENAKIIETDKADIEADTSSGADEFALPE